MQVVEVETFQFTGLTRVSLQFIAYKRMSTQIFSLPERLKKYNLHDLRIYRIHTHIRGSAGNELLRAISLRCENKSNASKNYTEYKSSFCFFNRIFIMWLYSFQYDMISNKLFLSASNCFFAKLWKG